MSITFTIAKSHPSLAGHFPGNPVVPGVVLLEHIKTCLSNAENHAVLSGFKNVKFLRPVLPEQEVVLELEIAGSNKQRFTCRHAGEKVLQGEIELRV